jgi:hypothetical protein
MRRDLMNGGFEIRTLMHQWASDVDFRFVMRLGYKVMLYAKRAKKKVNI